MEDTVMISVSFKRYGWYGRNSNHAYHRFKDLYPEHRGDSASVNFVTCHDGFTLYDLYAYNTKHNEKNGWNNSDGDNNGNSWNCGAEGETDDPQIEGLRLRMVKMHVQP